MLKSYSIKRETLKKPITADIALSNCANKLSFENTAKPKNHHFIKIATLLPQGDTVSSKYKFNYLLSLIIEVKLDILCT